MTSPKRQFLLILGMHLRQRLQNREFNSSPACKAATAPTSYLSLQTPAPLTAARVFNHSIYLSLLDICRDSKSRIFQPNKHPAAINEVRKGHSKESGFSSHVELLRFSIASYRTGACKQSHGNFSKQILLVVCKTVP